MTTETHDIAILFAQLGLPDGIAEIDAFIATHGPLPGSVLLHEASFWNPAQAALLREGMLDDSDWAEIIDSLDARLRQPIR